MKTGIEGIRLLHYYESCRLTAYPDPATGGAPWTIGWGDTGPDVVPNMCITQDEADDRFARRLAEEFEPAVDKYVTTSVNQREFDALVSIFYNAGVGNMRGSTLVRRLNAGDRMAAAIEFPKWNRAGGRVIKGLQRRRHAEMYVFRGGEAAIGIVQGARLFP